MDIPPHLSASGRQGGDGPATAAFPLENADCQDYLLECQRFAVQPTMTLARRWMWPSVATTDSARFAVTQAFWAATVCAAGVALLVTLNQLTGALLDAAAFAAVAIGLSRRSRVAALCGLGLYLVEEAYVLSQARPLTLLFVVMFTIAFVNGVRGAFALHRQGAEGTPGRVQTRTAA